MAFNRSIGQLIGQRIVQSAAALRQAQPAIKIATNQQPVHSEPAAPTQQTTRPTTQTPKQTPAPNATVQNFSVLDMATEVAKAMSQISDGKKAAEKPADKPSGKKAASTAEVPTKETPTSTPVKQKGPDLTTLLSELLAKSVKYVKANGLDKQVTLIGTAEEGEIKSYPSNLRSKGKRRGSKSTVEAWMSMEDGKKITWRNRNFLAHEYYLVIHDTLIEKGASERDARRIASEGFKISFLPLATFLEAEHKKETWPADDYQDFLKQLKETKAQLDAVRSANDTPAKTASAVEPDVTPSAEELTVEPLAEEQTVEPLTEEPTVEPMAEEPIIDLAKANIDPLLQIDGPYYESEGINAKAQVERLRAGGYDIGYPTRCFSTEEPKGKKFTIRPSEAANFDGTWEFNSWTAAGIVAADLKNTTAAPITPIDFQMLAFMREEEENRILDLLKSRGLGHDDVLTFVDGEPKTEVAWKFAKQVAEASWIPTVSYLVASLEGNNFFANRMNELQARLYIIEEMPLVEPEPAVTPQSEPVPNEQQSPDLQT